MAGAALFGALGAGAGLLGGLIQRSQFNRMLEQRNSAGNTLLQAIGSNTLPANYASPSYQELMESLRGFSGAFTQDMAPWYFWDNTQGDRDLLNSYSSEILPLLLQQGQLPSEFTDYFFPQMNQLISRGNYGADTAFANVNNNGWTEWGSNIFDPAMSAFQGNNPALANLLDVSGGELSQRGQTNWNQGGIQRAMDIFSNNGYNPAVQGMNQWANQNMNNPMIASLFNSGQGMLGGNPASQGVLASGQRMLGGNPGIQNQLGMTNQLLGNLFNTTGQTGANSNFINQGLGGLNQFTGADPESFLGARGGRALDSLQQSPYIGNSYDFIQNLIRGGNQNSGYSPQGQQVFNSAFPGLFNSINQSDGQMNQGWDRMMGASNASLDSMPSWLNNIAGLFGSQVMGNPLFGGGSGSGSASAFQLPTVGGGGVGGSASAPMVSRDVGQGELMTTPQAISIARDRAMSDAAGQAERMQRFALARGGGNNLYAGQTNRVMGNMGDEALRAEAAAVGQAAKDQQQLILQKQNMLMGANLADAQNSTQASIANSQANADASRTGLQGQIANASNALDLYRIQNDNALARSNLVGNFLNNLMNTSSDVRGQNMQERLAGLNNLAPLQNAMTQRQNTLSGLLSNFDNNATGRFNNSNQLASLLPQLANLDISRYSAIMDPLVSGQATGTNRGNLFAGLAQSGLADQTSRYGQSMNAGASLASILPGLFGADNQFRGIGADLTRTALDADNQFRGIGADLSRAALGSSDNRFGTAANMISNANNIATNNMRAGIDLFQAGNQDVNARYGLGQSGLNNYLSGILGFGNLGNEASRNAQNYGIGMGNLGNNLLGTQLGALGQGSTNILNWNNSDRANRTLGLDAYNNMFNQRQGLWNSFMQGIQNFGINPQLQMMSGLLNYMNTSNGLYGNYAGMFNQPNSANPFAGMFPNVNYNMSNRNP